MASKKANNPTKELSFHLHPHLKSSFLLVRVLQQAASCWFKFCSTSHPAYSGYESKTFIKIIHYHRLCCTASFFSSLCPFPAPSHDNV